MLPRRKRKKGGGKRKKGKRGKGGKGLFPVLKSFGVTAGASPALCEAAVLSVVSNTFDEARDSFARNGVEISVKRLRTISGKFSVAALDKRRRTTKALLGGKIAGAESSKAGGRVAITIDGGRIRTRRAKRGRKKKGTGRKGFHTDWREPKVYTIYEFDEEGRKKRKGFVSCDGTIDGPGPFIDILAAELVKVGASAAEELVVVADGAPWIWNHIDDLLAMAGIDPGKVTRILDFYHAVEHLKALSELLFKSRKGQSRWFNKMRDILKKRSPKVFMRELNNSIGESRNKEILKERNYFINNLESINYRIFKRRKMPIGSGVIESTIRRVVNLRLKGAGMFWLEENAEGLLHLRCQLKSGNWESFYAETLDDLSNLE